MKWVKAVKKDAGEVGIEAFRPIRGGPETIQNGRFQKPNRQIENILGSTA